MLVELKNGETLNGHLVNCDTYMNLTLKEVVQTSPEGDKFFRLPECYVRGNNVSGFWSPWVWWDGGPADGAIDQVPAGTGRDCGYCEGTAADATITARRQRRHAAERRLRWARRQRSWRERRSW